MRILCTAQARRCSLLGASAGGTAPLTQARSNAGAAVGIRPELYPSYTANAKQASSGANSGGNNGAAKPAQPQHSGRQPQPPASQLDPSGNRREGVIGEVPSPSLVSPSASSPSSCTSSGSTSTTRPAPDVSAAAVRSAVSRQEATGSSTSSSSGTPRGGSKTASAITATATTATAGTGPSSNRKSGAREAQPRKTLSRSPPAPATPTPPPPEHSAGGYTLVSSAAELNVMLDQLVAAGYGKGADGSAAGGGGGSGNSGGGGPLAVDCEGIELGRPEGRLCVLQLSARCAGGGGRSGRSGVSIWLVDVERLGWRAFQYRSRLDGATSLRSLLEDPAVTKYLYDVRNDAAALASQFGVRLRGVVDLQLADVAVRQAEDGVRGNCWVEGLVSALSRRLTREGRVAAPARLAEDMAAATSVARWYHSRNNTEVWAERPLTSELCEYAATDVRYLHLLADALSPRLSKDLADRVAHESHRRTVVRVPNNQSRAEAPIMVPLRRPATTSATTAMSPSPSGVEAGWTGLAGERAGNAVVSMGLMEWLTVALLLRYDRYGIAPPPAPAALGQQAEGGGLWAEALPAADSLNRGYASMGVGAEWGLESMTRNLAHDPGSVAYPPRARVPETADSQGTGLAPAGLTDMGAVGEAEAAGETAGATPPDSTSPLNAAIELAVDGLNAATELAADGLNAATELAADGLKAATELAADGLNAATELAADGDADAAEQHVGMTGGGWQPLPEPKPTLEGGSGAKSTSTSMLSSAGDSATWAERLAAAEAAFAAIEQRPRGTTTASAAAPTATIAAEANAAREASLPPLTPAKSPSASTPTPSLHHRPNTPSAPPLLVPSKETMMWAEQVLINARDAPEALEGRQPTARRLLRDNAHSLVMPAASMPAPAGAVAQDTTSAVGPESGGSRRLEEAVRARAAVGWLRRSQRTLEARLGRAPSLVRRDPGLKWLLPPP